MSVNSKIYTKTGDRGTTSLKGSMNVSKADNRIELIGTIEELSSQIGIVKAQTSCADMTQTLESIQKNLQIIAGGVRDSFNQKARLSSSDVMLLEQIIDETATKFSLEVDVLPGENRLSALLDLAQAVTRRVERRMTALAAHYAIPAIHKEYMNRLSDYFYIAARYVESPQGKASNPVNQREGENPISPVQSLEERRVVEQVVRQIKGPARIGLDEAKQLIEKLEAFSRSKGINSVISVCGPDGNMIAVHAMDDAFIASFDISMKKAYTSVAVKMSTMELSKLAQPGETFYGVENTDGGRIVILGGGIPLTYHGKIIGGLGVSGGTGEQDHEAASYGAKCLVELMK